VGNFTPRLTGLGLTVLATFWLLEAPSAFRPFH
jgi:hypothetical protein